MKKTFYKGIELHALGNIVGLNFYQKTDLLTDEYSLNIKDYNIKDFYNEMKKQKTDCDIFEYNGKLYIPTNTKLSGIILNLNNKHFKPLEEYKRKYKNNSIKQVNNANGIKLFYEIEKENNRVCILDSNKKYFDDISLVYEDTEKDIEFIRKVLEQTTLEEMCVFFGTHKIIPSKEKTNYGSDYINTFKQNNDTILVAFED